MISTATLFGLFLVLGHVFTKHGDIEEVGRTHYFVHSLYARLEPTVIKVNDFMVSSAFFTKNPLGRAIFKLMAWTNVLLPHGVVIPTSSAIKILRDIEKRSGEKAHIAVGPCVCRKCLDRPCDTMMKDMTIWYGAEIYRKHFGDDYRDLSADEAVVMLQEFHKQGLVQVIEFLMQSRRWMFVLCNCDKEVCCPTRTYNAIGRSLYPGPYIATQDKSGCIGKAECGMCVERCHFDANAIDADGKATLIADKCLGCGLCVTTCKGKVRRLVKREGYSGRLLPWEYVMESTDSIEG